MKREYTITMPFTGTITRTVVAESEEQAKDEFLETTGLTDLINGEADGVWEFCEAIVEGNVFYGVQREMEIEEGEEVEE